MLQLDQTKLDEVLFDRLAGLDEESLARVLANRADALDPPWPRRLEDLVRRLSTPDSIVLAMRGLTKPGFQVMRAIRLLVGLRGADRVEVSEVAEWLGTTADEVTPILDALADRVLAWPVGKGRIRTPPSHDVISLDFAGLGPPIVDYLSQQTVQQLKVMGAALGVRVEGRKGQIIDQLLAFFRDRAGITKLLGAAPAGTDELLADFAWDGPERECYLGYGYYGYRRDQPESPERWAADRGLLWSNHDGSATMPLEVGLALRGPDYRLPFAPRPPAPAVLPVSVERVLAESSAAALRLVDRTCAVLDYAAAQPIPLIKTGRVGARAIKTLARDTGSSAEETRLAVELAIRMLLLAPAEVEQAPVATRHRRGSRASRPEPLAELVPTERRASWQRAGSAERLRSALCSWWTLPLAPLANEKVVRSVLGDEPSGAFVDIRQLTVRLVVQLPDGGGVADDAALAELATWHAPTVNPDLLGTLVSGALAEAALLGVTGSGAAGELARALVEGTPPHGRPVGVDDPILVKAADQLVAEARTTALFGADLTAVVTGPPGAELAGLLDRAADRESTGAASTWRFSPASVRRAFDNGTTPDALLDELRAVAQKPLPQPLEYLVNDVARRHGEVGVIGAGCVVVGEEAALLAEIAAHRKLVALGLRPVAPTVLVATASVEATMAALRGAGYAPVPRSADGTVAVRPATDSPKTIVPAALANSSAAIAQDPRVHAVRLLSGPARSDRRRMRRGALTDVLYRARGERPTPAWMEFAWRLEIGQPARVVYLEPDGGRVELVVSDAELDGDAIDVWCEETSGYRRLELARVRPAS